MLGPLPVGAPPVCGEIELDVLLCNRNGLQDVTQQGRFTSKDRRMTATFQRRFRPI
jgi:hypothetical protein